MTDQKIIAMLNKIRDDGDLSYKNAVPKLKEGDLLSTYGASILGNPFVKNQFLNSFMNFFMYEETKQHIFESDFDRLKNPANINRYGSFEAFRNTIKPMRYDESKLDRILKLYKPDVKTAYFARNRQDIFPMSISREELEVAFQDYRAFDTFVTGLYEQLVNSNKVVEYNAIKECINVNLLGGAIKRVDLTNGVTDRTATSIAKMIRSYVIRMGKPSTEYNAYADLEGATGAPVETSTPKKSLLLIADADTISTVSVDVLASAFNLAYADFDINLIEVDDFGYNIYDRNTRTIAGHNRSPIKFIICDEALFKIEDNLDVTMEGTNDAALMKQTFYHIWQTIQLRPWANAVAFCLPQETEIKTDNEFVTYGNPATITYKPVTSQMETDTVLRSSDGVEIPRKVPEDLKAETTILAEIAEKMFTAITTKLNYDNTSKKDDGIIIVSRVDDELVTAGTYKAGETDETVISETEYKTFVENYGDNCYLDIATFASNELDTYYVSSFLSMNTSVSPLTINKKAVV